MKKLLSALAILFVVCIPHLSIAQTVSLADADKLLYFAETAEPGLFNPPSATQQINLAGSDWYYRYFSGSQTYLAININGNGPFFSGEVYVLGGSFGDELVFIDTLANLLAYVDSLLIPVVTLEDAEKLFNFAEVAEAGLFFPPTETELTNEFGNDWYVRYYPYSQNHIKVNINGIGPFVGGNVYLLGEDFGDQEVFIDTLDNLIAYIDSLSGGGGETGIAIDRAKGFISDLRDISASIQIATIEDELGTFGNAIELAFEEQINLVTGVVSNDLGLVTEAIAISLDAFSQTLGALNEDPALTSYDALSGGELITVSIGENDDGVILSIDQDIAGINVALTANVDLEITETAQGNTETSTTVLNFAISGTAVNEEFSLAIYEGSQANANISESITESDTNADESSTFDAHVLSADLIVSITALQATAIPTFDGELRFNLTDVVIDTSLITEQTQNQTTTTEHESITFGTMEFSMSGTFSDTTGNSVGASFSLSFQNSEEDTVVFEYSEIFMFDQILGFTYTETESGETTESSVSARAVIQIDVALPGIDNSTALTIDIARTGLFDGEGFITLEFNDKTVVFFGNSTDSEFIVTDLDGVVAHIAENLGTGLLEGYITVDNLEVATIEETENGMVLVRYSDGSFESLSF